MKSKKPNNTLKYGGEGGRCPSLSIQYII